jgi:hypothetical protein
MKNLIPIIGKSPSEKLFEEFIIDLQKERVRVREALDSFKATPPPKKKPKASLAKQKQLMLDLGIDQSDIDKFMEMKKNERGKDI